MTGAARGPRVVVVTGAGSGIGAAAARAFVDAGDRVLALDRDLVAAGRVAHELGERCEAAEVDVGDEASVRRALGGAGEVAVLANVAGVGSTQSTPDTDLETWERVFAVNARGTFLMCKHVLPGMQARGDGVIVNVASIAGLVGLRNRAAYCASKGAVVGLTKAIAVDHVGEGVRANAVCPGTTDTPWVERLVRDAGESLDALRARQPMGRLGRPDEIAAAIVYLASDAARFITGTELVIDGGLTAA